MTKDKKPSELVNNGVIGEVNGSSISLFHGMTVFCKIFSFFYLVYDFCKNKQKKNNKQTINNKKKKKKKNKTKKKKKKKKKKNTKKKKRKKKKKKNEQPDSLVLLPSDGRSITSKSSKMSISDILMYK